MQSILFLFLFFYINYACPLSSSVCANHRSSLVGLQYDVPMIRNDECIVYQDSCRPLIRRWRRSYDLEHLVELVELTHPTT